MFGRGWWGRAKARRERPVVKDFVEHQPYLFEPNHAFDFRLLSYQERLKTGYQENRRRRAAG